MDSDHDRSDRSGVTDKIHKQDRVDTAKIDSQHFENVDHYNDGDERLETVDVTVKSDRVEKTERLNQSQRNHLPENHFGELENTLYSSSSK